MKGGDGNVEVRGEKETRMGEGNDKRMSGDKIRCSEGDDIEKEKRGR